MNQAHAIGAIGRDGDVTVHPLPTPAGAPVGSTTGADSALWFVEIGAGQIGRIAPDGKIGEFALPDPASRPHAIAAGADGAC